jgi:hypothetical protein
MLFIGCEAVTSLVMTLSIFWDTTQYAPLNISPHFGADFHLIPHGPKNKPSRIPAWSIYEAEPTTFVHRTTQDNIRIVTHREPDLSSNCSGSCHRMSGKLHLK